MVLSKVHRSDCWTVYLYARHSSSNVQLLEQLQVLFLVFFLKAYKEAY